jgi:O-antigen ligase
MMFGLLLTTLLIISALTVPAKIFWRPEYLFAGLLFWIALIQSGRIVTDQWKEATLLLALMFSAALSVFIQGMVYGFESTRDLMIILRYAYYIAILGTGVYLGYRVKSLKPLYLLFGVFAISAPALSLLQYFNFADVNRITVALYEPDNQALLHGESWRRVSGTMGNPNYWGLMLAVNAVTAIIVAITRRKYTLLLIAACNLTALFTTGSRSALLTAVIVLPIVWVISESKTIFSIKLIAMTGIGAGIMLIAFALATYFQVEADRYVGGDLTTMWGRIRHWGDAIAMMFAVPYQLLIGKGPTKLQNIDWADNMYVRMLRDFGLVGLSIYAAFCLVVLKRLWCLSKTVSDDQKILLIAVTAFWCGILVIDMSADSWFVVRLAGLFLILYGFMSGYYLRHAKQAH